MAADKYVETKIGTCSFCGSFAQELIQAAQKVPGKALGTFTHKGEEERTSGYGRLICRDCVIQPFIDAGRTKEWAKNWWDRQTGRVHNGI